VARFRRQFGTICIAVDFVCVVHPAAEVTA
jgi:hypothetical protein